MDEIAIAGITTLLVLGVSMFLSMPNGNGLQAEGPENICIYTVGGDTYSLTKSRAIEIALESDCADYGEPTGKAHCNQKTGEWWLALDSTQCDPVCKVGLATRQAVVEPNCS